MTTLSHAVEELKTLIRASGLRSTGARVAVLRHLMTQPAPLSHAEIATGLDELGYDRATVYRNLVSLAEAGLVRRTDHGDRVWRYEYNSADHETTGLHPHFVCETCGSVTCLPNVEVTITSTTPKALGGMGRVSEVVLKGCCEHCQTAG